MEIDYAGLIGIVVTTIISIGGVSYLVVKRKITEIRKFVDTVDDALYDDKVSPEEFIQIYEAVKPLPVINTPAK